MILVSLCFKFNANNYFNTKGLTKLLQKIMWYSFLIHVVDHANDGQTELP